MSEPEKPKKRMTNQTYPERIPVYDTKAGKDALEAIARRRLCSVAAAVRQLIREEAERAGIPVREEDAPEN